jgi:tRNA(His) 5'-end guanylyltransferase
MANTDFRGLGDVQKKYENISRTKLMPNLPVLARLNGRAFHTVLKTAAKPFDEHFVRAMQITSQVLLNDFNASLSYTQSDEITLYWPALDTFDGNIQKLCSTMAGMASVVFNQEYVKYAPKLQVIPMFDCRVWQVPTAQIAAENFLWREHDARKNSINMLANSKFSSVELEGISTKERLQMLESKGIIWGYLPDQYKRGTFYKKVLVRKTLSKEELKKIPKQYRPTGTVIRNLVSNMEWPRLSTIANLAEFMFEDARAEFYDIYQNMEEL